jgi:hypothetical protein
MRMLPQEHKERRAEICVEFARHCENTGEVFLSIFYLVMKPGFTTIGQTLKRQSMEWNRLSSPARRKFKVQVSVGTFMLTLFFNMDGSIFAHHMEPDTSVPHVSYCNMF